MSLDEQLRALKRHLLTDGSVVIMPTLRELAEHEPMWRKAREAYLALGDPDMTTLHPRPKVDLSRSLIDPPHVRDMGAACWGCGARWFEEHKNLMAMDHADGCEYMAGKEREDG